MDSKSQIHPVDPLPRDRIDSARPDPPVHVTPGDRPVGHVGMSNLREALEGAQAQLLRYRELFDFAPDGYIVTDMKGIIQEANHVAASMLGTRRHFMVDKPLIFYLARGDRGFFVSQLYQLAARHRERLQWELRLQPPGKDAIYALVTVSSTPVDDAGGALRWILRDISERYRAEQSLRAEKDFANKLIDLAEAIIVVLNPEGRIARTNRYTYSLLGRDDHELAGKRLVELVVAEDRASAENMLKGLGWGQLNVHGVHRLQTKQGQTLTVAWAGTSWRPAADGSGWTVVVGNDITELQAAQERALQSERLAAIGQMVTGLAHESRNALQRGQACLEMLCIRLQGQQENLELVRRVERAQDDLHRLYEGVREYSAPIHLEMRSCNLAEVWREAWADLESARRNRSVELHEQYETSDAWCEASPFHLRQVFRNILENALAAVHGDVRITITCTKGELGGREAIVTAVEDNGPGFSHQQRRSAFEPFFTTKLHGTGLGLPICKRMVDAHGGQIAIGEGSASGACIVITLPRRTA